jgi:ketosteroid isomerase-like protein
MRFKKSLLTILLYLFIGFFVCSRLSAQDISQADRDELKRINNILTKAILDGDYETVLKYYTEDVIIMPDFMSAIRGIDALEKQYREDQKKGIIYHSFSGTAEKRWQHDNEIYETGSFGMAVSSRESKRPKAYYGSYFQIWDKQKDGSFKISYNIWNLDFNPFE